MKLSSINLSLNSPPALEPKLSKKASPSDFNPLDYIQEPVECKTSPFQELKIDGLRMVINGNLVQFQQDPMMKTIQDIYMRVFDNGLLFSVDRINWRAFEDLFGFDCDFSFQMDQEAKSTELNVNLHVETLS